MAKKPPPLTLDNPLEFPAQLKDFRERKCLVSIEKRLSIGDTFRADGIDYEVIRVARLTLALARSCYCALGFYLPDHFIRAFEKRYGRSGPARLVWLYFYKQCGGGRDES